MAASQPPNPPSALLARVLEQTELRAKSAIVTAFGDVVLPRGGSTWLGSVIRMLEPLGIGERVVRTAVFRLAQDGTLTASQRGRRSFYALTEIGRSAFERAESRIYASAVSAWSGDWTLVILTGGLSGARRDAVRQDLGWMGFAGLSSGIMARAGSHVTSAERIVREHKASGQAVVLSARADDPDALTPMRSLVADAWPLEDLARDYAAFLSVFGDVRKRLEHTEEPLEPSLALSLRLLLIHGYRRILLKDPDLPVALLPAGWPGTSARTLTSELYKTLAPLSEAAADKLLETEDGPAPPPTPATSLRFRGGDGQESAA